jgi:hypothetical protein
MCVGEGKCECGMLVSALFVVEGVIFVCRVSATLTGTACSRHLAARVMSTDGLLS